MFGTWWDHIILYLIEGLLSSFGVLGKSTCCFLAYFLAIFRKLSDYLLSTKHLERFLQLFISCFNCP